MRSDGGSADAAVVSKNTNELKTGAPGGLGLEVSTLGSPMEARIFRHGDADLALDIGLSQ